LSRGSRFSFRFSDSSGRRCRLGSRFRGGRSVSLVSRVGGSSGLTSLHIDQDGRCGLSTKPVGTGERGLVGRSGREEIGLESVRLET